MDKRKTEPAGHGFKNPEFTREMRKTYSILAPDIFPIHMDLIRRIFRSYGYNIEILRSRGKQIIEKGLEHIHNDMCYPLICIAGQQLSALASGEYDPDKSALIMFQTGGGCRASNYIWLLRKALRSMGMEQVPVISLSLNRMERSGGFRVYPMMLVKTMVAIIYGDLLMLLRNQVRPYEKVKGETEKTLKKWSERLTDEFRKNKGLFGRAFKNNLRAIAGDFDSIPTTDAKKTRVGIVGEIYVKYSPLGNNGLEELLDSLNCEYMVPGVLGFFQFMFDNRLTDQKLYGGSRAGACVAALGALVARRIEKTFTDVLREFPRFTAPSPFEHIRELGSAVIGREVKMGEGWLLPAEAAELIENGYTNIICVQPFGCLPNHIVGKGTMRTLKKLYPHANICPIDYDSGASGVNQENRIRLMLAMAEEQQ
ncbi:MAG: 2-hydroxyacyl-CoA dehydratase [Abditibacteriota bacterium]|nr:2-hydroxyacyl-CoA dehydratase [Abditibacteriota bacterium]